MSLQTHCDCTGTTDRLPRSDELIAGPTIADAPALAAENQTLKQRLANQLSRQLIGTSAAAVNLRQSIAAAALNDDPVLVRGEPGTELGCVGLAVHALSRRAHRPLARFDCRMFTCEGLQAALFRGETPHSARPLEWAAGGVLFLEHIDHTTLDFQQLLLQALEPGRSPSEPQMTQRLGDARLVVSTHVDLLREARRRWFNARLAELLSRQTVTILPLRKRGDDIGMLCDAVLSRLANAAGTPVKRLTRDALTLLESHSWPGNMSELEHVLAQVCSIDDDPRLTAEALRPWLAVKCRCPDDLVDTLSLEQMERRLIETTFARCGGNRERTARALKIGLRTLSGKLREYGYPPRGGPGSNRTASMERVA